MFEQTSRLAEQVATSVSRRRFLGSLSRWAAVMAVGLAGFLTGGPARGGRANGGHLCCVYGVPVCQNPTSCTRCVKRKDGCPATGNGLPLSYSFGVDPQCLACPSCPCTT